MTDRDHFAAAALTGLLGLNVDDEFAMPYIVGRAYLWADAMLRERSRAGQNSSEGTASDAKCTERDSHIPDAGKMAETSGETNHDAAPAAIAAKNDGPPRERKVPDGTGDTDHGASPEARASVDSVAPQPTTRGESDRNDKAAPRPSEGTGDTPDSPQPIACSVFDRSQPIAKPTPVHTPPAHATPSVGSVPRDGTEPVAWGVANGSRVLATSISRTDAVDMQSDYAYHTEIVPLYRSPPCQDFSQNNLTLTDAEREAIYRASQYLSQNDVFEGMAEDAAVLRGLLERIGGRK